MNETTVVCFHVLQGSDSGLPPCAQIGSVRLRFIVLNYTYRSALIQVGLYSNFQNADETKQGVCGTAKSMDHEPANVADAWL